jgi:hypothetical protein
MLTLASVVAVLAHIQIKAKQFLVKRNIKVNNLSKVWRKAPENL